MEQFQRLLNIIKTLRGDNGCPWDREQTIETLAPDIIEETYEVIDAIDNNQIDDLEEELGDLLFLILFISYIAEQENKLTIENVIKKISDKLIRRHPHVFAGLKVDGVDTIIENWESIKLTESKNLKRKTPFDGIPKGLPEVQRYFKIMDKIKLSGKEINELKNKELIGLFNKFFDNDNQNDTVNFIESLLTYCYNNKIDLSGIIRKITNQNIENFEKK